MEPDLELKLREEEELSFDGMFKVISENPTYRRYYDAYVHFNSQVIGIIPKERFEMNIRENGVKGLKSAVMGGLIICLKEQGIEGWNNLYGNLISNRGWGNIVV